MLRIASMILGGLVITVTILPLFKSRAWWVRIWDFPRFQIAVAGSLAFAGASISGGTRPAAASWLFLGALGAAVLYQTGRVWRYSRFAPLEVEQNRSSSKPRLRLAVSNVLETNRESDRLIGVLQAADADVMLFVETDDWWRRRLDVLLRTHPHTLQCPLSNTYGMLLYSRLELLDTSIDFLIEPDIPSMQARVRLADDTTVWLNCVHPRPPAPGESDESLERDAELLLVGKRVCDAKVPVVVCGDLNDVAWSRTTRLFQKTSRLVDPRKGRGMFSTFHARFPGCRFPLDHILHSTEFRLVEMRRLAFVGSDHFPVVATLSLEPDAAAQQEAPAADSADRQEAGETIAEGASGQGSGVG
ncbi:MAG TPA: endonuclease/exonuclease/phosphatase family protein [Gemmatimonadaceae bacterium]|nr:endonuclease/exonuclease/phosphatase family protein [Gemmatimonadaceae bacterium]